jgi:outer membrane cobalamin receptor
MRQFDSKSCIFLLSFLGIVAGANAQVPADTAGANALPATEVRTQINPIDQVGPAPIVLKPADWEGSGLGLADLLATQAGMHTRRMGGMGSFQAVSIRGVAANKVVVCIDGIPLAENHGAAFNLGSVDLNQLERVEVFKGTVPAAFGGNGLGGAINLVTRKKVGQAGKVQASYGSHNTGEASLTLGSNLTDSLRWNSSVSWRFSDNDYKYYDRNGTPYNHEDDTTRTQSNARFNQFSGSHGWSLIRKSGELRLNLGHSQESGGIPGTESQHTHVAGFDQQFVASRLTWLNRPWGTGLRLEAELGARLGKDLFHWSNGIDGLGYSVGDPNYQEIGSRSLKADGALRLFGEWNEPYGFESHLSGFAEQLDPRDHPATLNSWQWRLQRHSLTSATEASWAPQSWMALRMHYQATAQIDHNSGGVLRTTFPDTMEAEADSRMAQALQGSLRWGKPTFPFHVSVSGGHHYRIPELREQYSTGMGIVANPDLKPESGEKVELAGEYEVKKTRLQIALFWNQSRNGIYYVNSAGLSKPMNLTRNDNLGCELDFHSQPLLWLDVSAQATLQNPRNQSPLGAYLGKLTPNEPQLSTGSEFTLRLGPKWDVGLRAEWRSEVFRDPANQMRIAPQEGIHSTVSFKPWKQGVLRFSATNLTGVEYQDVYSAYPTPGRQYFIHLTQTF